METSIEAEPAILLDLVIRRRVRLRLWFLRIRAGTPIHALWFLGGRVCWSQMRKKFCVANQTTRRELKLTLIRPCIRLHSIRTLRFTVPVSRHPRTRRRLECKSVMESRKWGKKVWVELATNFGGLPRSRLVCRENLFCLDPRRLSASGESRLCADDAGDGVVDDAGCLELVAADEAASWCSRALSMPMVLIGRSALSESGVEWVAGLAAVAAAFAAARRCSKLAVA
ncbi:hypothetical protein CAOG_009589 [Capsaspora owczarzaki ATCC 30864]|uniref:Uncharacterized protein n=1 Tax=Capsaspora owczarzaki (strain ATCC 30864) TaxID=595528 RepID=A0A0D2X218_CAPO3|nr:hypothetical protein CAOG_009589 [Capsaspora owczarzaki ATCC 30864]